uniref:Solute carrier family 1 member 3 n=1 Tax=Ovis aries TaxID=9940 RepID=A0AC11EFY5_SHEEP
MTKSNGEEARLGGRMERFQQGVRKRTLLAKKKVQNITKEDVKSYLFRNAFVLLTVTAVIVGSYSYPPQCSGCSSLLSGHVHSCFITTVT